MCRLHWIEPDRSNLVAEQNGTSSGPKVAIWAHRDGKKDCIIIQEVPHDLVAWHAIAGCTSPFVDFLQHVTTCDS